MQLYFWKPLNKCGGISSAITRSLRDYLLPQNGGVKKAFQDMESALRENRMTLEAIKTTQADRDLFKHLITESTNYVAADYTMIRACLAGGDVVQDFLKTLARGQSIQVTGASRTNESLTVQQLAAVREVQGVLRRSEIAPKMRVSVGQHLGNVLSQIGRAHV